MLFVLLRPCLDDQVCFPRGKPQGEKIIRQVSRPVSTGQLHVLPRFHTRPINEVVFFGTLGARGPGRSYLEAGFPLRCFQRLSDPFVATRQCSWRHNRNTRGMFNPVLSY